MYRLLSRGAAQIQTECTVRSTRNLPLLHQKTNVLKFLWKREVHYCLTKIRVWSRLGTTIQSACYATTTYAPFLRKNASAKARYLVPPIVPLDSVPAVSPISRSCPSVQSPQVWVEPRSVKIESFPTNSETQTSGKTKLLPWWACARTAPRPLRWAFHLVTLPLLCGAVAVHTAKDREQDIPSGGSRRVLLSCTIYFGAMTLAVLAGAHSAMQMTGFAFPSTRANKGLHNAVIYAGSMGAAGGIASIISTTAGDFPLSSLRTIALSHVAFLGIEYILHTKKCVPKWLVEFTSDWVRKFLLTEAKDVLLLEVVFRH
eukprot:GHVT01043984.1.p2 GENE.GHVT01043984.1~~GHVT01043984.1.p2  ORF type:complete len:315 (-),score=5.03 GHVT01043984.1:2834-3778(-)